MKSYLKWNNEFYMIVPNQNFGGTAIASQDEDFVTFILEITNYEKKKYTFTQFIKAEFS